MPQPQIIQKPLLAIAGRTNVGKSTLFNRLVEEFRALVSPVAGTTRSPNYGEAIWRGRVLAVVDTGGLEKKRRDPFAEPIARQAAAALREAAVVLFLIDARVPLTTSDREIAQFLRASKKIVLLAANKAERKTDRESLKWKALGLGNIHWISAATGMGVGDLLDDALQALETAGQTAPTVAEALGPIAVAIIGKPNVGKSSLLNKLVGSERAIVSEIAHTTREPQDTLVRINEDLFLFIDTAGIRKKMKQRQGLEAAGVKKSLGSIDRADVLLLVIDVEDANTTQDRHLAGIATESGKGLILAANKWDLVEDRKTTTPDQFRAALYRAFPFIVWAPVHFISAKTGAHVHKLYQEIKRVAENRQREVPNKELEEFLRQTIARHRPPRRRGAPAPRIYGIKQIGSEPPTFELAVRETQVGANRLTVPTSYVRYIENQLRKNWDFFGTPIKMQVRPVSGR